MTLQTALDSREPGVFKFLSTAGRVIGLYLASFLPFLACYVVFVDATFGKEWSLWHAVWVHFVMTAFGLLIYGELEFIYSKNYPDSFHKDMDDHSPVHAVLRTLSDEAPFILVIGWYYFLVDVPYVIFKICVGGILRLCWGLFLSVLVILRYVYRRTFGGIRLLWPIS